MSLTIGEANAVNVLLHFFLQDPGRHEIPTPERALEAANLLAQKASKALGAGYTGRGDIDRLWPSEASTTVT